MSNFVDVDMILNCDGIVLITLPVKLKGLRVKTRIWLDSDEKGEFVEEVAIHDDDVTVDGYEGAEIDIVTMTAINDAVARQWMFDQIPQEHTEDGYIEPED